MEILDLLAREYVELTLIKHAWHDPWDVYWLADSPFWKRTELSVNRYSSVYPYKPMPLQNEMTLPDILAQARALQDELMHLKGRCNGNDALRLDYLIEHNRALITRVLHLSGEKLSYDEYCLGMFGLKAPQTEEERLEEMLGRLDDVLPSGGSLASRIEDFRNRIRIPADRIPAVMNRAARFFHDMAVEHMGVKDGNMPRLRYRHLGNKEFVTVLWGYDYDEVSLEQNFSRDYPYYLDTLREIAGHELEPGHFTFMNLRTKGMVDTGYVELGLNSHSPSSSFIEGGARIAIELSLDTPEKERVFDEELFALAGADSGLIDCMPVWRQFVWLSNYGKLEIERNLWDGVWDREQALAYAKRWCILPPDAAETAVLTLAEDEGHFTSHDYCRDVVRAYYNGRFASTEEKWKAYTRLCQRPFTMAGIIDGSFDPFAFED